MTSSMKQAPLLTSARSSATTVTAGSRNNESVSSGAPRKPVLRSRPSPTLRSPATSSLPITPPPAAVGHSPSPVHLSPVGAGGSSAFQPKSMGDSPSLPCEAGGAAAVTNDSALARALVPGSVDSPGLAVPSSNALVRALLRKPRVAAPTATAKAAAQCLPPAGAFSPRADAAALDVCEETTHGEAHDALTGSRVNSAAAGEKRVRKIASASSQSIASSAATPLGKRLALDRPDAATPSADAAPASSSATPPLRVADVERLIAMGPVAAAFAVGSVEDDSDAAVAVSPMARARVLDEDLLRDWTGYEDLDLVVRFELRVDATKVTGIDALGRMLPRLSSLKVSRSYIPRLRLLGTRYTNLRRLWISNCKLEDLRGIGALAPGLVELYAAFNSITDVAPLLDISATLEVLDLEGNQLEDAKRLQLVFPSLTRVTALSLAGNPVVFRTDAVRAALAEQVAQLACGSPTAQTTENPLAAAEGTGDEGSGVQTLRAWVGAMMPQLEWLDDLPAHENAGGHKQETGPGVARAELLDERASSCLSRADGSSSPAPQCRRQSSLHADPMDAALSKELSLLQDCLRESDGLNDRLSDTLERTHAGLYSRPSTSCMSGARQRLGSASRSGLHSRCPTATTSLSSSHAARQTSAMSGAAKIRLGSRESTAAASDLTKGSVFAGNAIAGLRRRLQATGAATPAPAGGLEDVAAQRRSHCSSSANSRLGTQTNPDQTAEVSEARETDHEQDQDSSDAAADPRDDGFGSSRDSHAESGSDTAAEIAAEVVGAQDEEWDAFKAELLRTRARAAAQQYPLARYRVLYDQMFADEATGDSASQRQRDNSTMDAAVKAEVVRARARMAALFSADEARTERAAAETMAGAEREWHPAAAGQADACLPTHQPDVLDLAEEQS